MARRSRGPAVYDLRMKWAGVVLFLISCGEVKGNPDGGGGDGGSDASPDGPLVGEATVEVLLAGMPTGGITVNFHESDGSLITEAMTDTTGKAKATVHINAMVTVAVDTRNLATITGVNPGETVVFKTPKPYDGSLAGDVTFSASGEAPNKSYYRVDLGDDQYSTYTAMTSGTRSINLKRANLDGNGKFNMYVGTYDVNNRFISYSFVTGITPSGTGVTAVSVPNNWRTDLNEFAVMMSGAPTGATRLDSVTWSELASMQYAPSDFGTPITPDSVTITGGNASINQRYAGSYGDFIQTQLSVFFGTTRESAAFWRRVPRPAGAYTITSNSFAARIGAPTVDKAMPTRPIVNWTVTGSTVNGDATIVNLDWRDGANVAYSWVLYVPPDATSVTAPAVSSSLAAQAPAQSTYTNVQVTQSNLDPLAGYAAFHLLPIEANRYMYPLPPGFTSWSYSSNSTLNP